jgi:hypothetical protein
MNGDKLENNMGDGGLFHWKVGNPTTSNNIVQMRSGNEQPPFRAGGNQVPFFLGVKGNCCITSTSVTPRSMYLDVLSQHK